MAIIKGCAVTLYEMTESGIDDFNNPIYGETAIEVDNVLVEPVSNDALVTELQLTGKKMAYVLHIPKGDAHNWKDAKVKLPNPWDVTVRTYGDCIVYQNDMVPLDWNKKIKVELYE